MKIGIIGAMDQEVKILKEKLTDTMSWERAGALFVSGSLGRHEVIVVRSGIGKVASAVTTTLLIHQYGVNMVINTGSAGGIGEGLKVGDLVIADKLAYFDVDVTGFGYAYVTGDTFVDSAEKIAKIKKEFPEALACEMEGAAIGQAASQFNIPFLVVRAMSDTADGEATQSFDEFIDEAGKKSAEMVIHFVENLV